MIVDLDTRKMVFKKDDLMISNGKKLIVISKAEFLKPVYAEIKELKGTINLMEQAIKVEQNKRSKFVKAFKGGSK